MFSERMTFWREAGIDRLAPKIRFAGALGLLKPRVLSLGLLQDRNIWVGVFP